MKKNLASALLVVFIVFISCDQDFNTVGADLVGNEHFDFDKYEVQNLKAYSVKTEEVQTNNLPVNPLGVYDNPYFGKTTANFVTQVSVSVLQPKFGTNVQIENVTLYIPYFSSLKTSNADGSKEYNLDSIYSKQTSSIESKIKLSVYENGYQLSSFLGTDQTQASKYYSGFNSFIDAQKRGHDNNGNSVGGGIRLNDATDTAENDQFFFNKKEIIVYKTKFNTTTGILEYVDADNNVLSNQLDATIRVIKERLAPGIYLTLNKDFFKKKILETSASNLLNNNDFRSHFKGLYFKTEEILGESGAMAQIDFKNAKLNVNYSSINAGAAAGASATSKTYLINLGSSREDNTVSLQNFTYTGNYNTNLLASNQVSGNNNNLYLKGGKGSVVYMDVFGDDIFQSDFSTPGANGIPDELDKLKLNNWLINDAYLEFYINQTELNNISADQETKDNEPLRLYLFDATNQRPLVDYILDTSTSSNIKKSKQVYDGIIQRDASGKGFKYKIRITQHINNLLNSTNPNFNKNIKLGLSVSENIFESRNYNFENEKIFSIGPNISVFPVASILSQQGTVLFGTAPALAADANKKLKLTIHFTKPN